MKARLGAAFIVAAAAGIAVAAVQQEEHQPPKPGKFHDFLKQFEGTWETKSEFKMAADQPVMTWQGTETDKFGVGGLFLMTDIASDMGGMKFEAHSIWGYDELKKKYSGSWVDNMSTAIWPFEGTVDDAGKVFTLSMEGPNPETGKVMKLRLIHKIAGKDARTLQLFMPGQDGKEMEMKIDYKRKK